MRERELFDELLTENEKTELLGRKPIKLSYKFSEFDYNTSGKERIVSGIKKLDYMLKGFELGCITLWSGATNSGKTSILTLITRETLKQHNKVFFFNGEQTKDDFKNNLYKSSANGINDLIQVEKNGITDYYVKEELARKLDKDYGENLIVFNNDMPRDIDTLLLAMEEANEKDGVKCFILDNFMQIDLQTENIYQEQSVIMEKLRTFAVNKEVHIHLVAHPRKIENFQVRLSLYDVAGTMNIPNKAYNVISIIRKSSIVQSSYEYKRIRLDLAKAGYDMGECDGMLEVLKTKGNENGIIGLVFDKTLRTYRIAKEYFGSEKEELIRNAELDVESKKNMRQF